LTLSVFIRIFQTKFLKLIRCLGILLRQGVDQVFCRLN